MSSITGPRLKVDRVFTELTELLTEADPERCVGALRLTLSHSLNFGEEFRCHLARLEQIAAEQFAPNVERDAVVKRVIVQLADALSRLGETERRCAEKDADRKALEENLRALEARRVAITDAEARLAEVEAEVAQMSIESGNLDCEIAELLRARDRERADRISRGTKACAAMRIALLERFATLLEVSDQMLQELRLQVEDDADIAAAIAASPAMAEADTVAILAGAKEVQIAVRTLERALKAAIERRTE